jgi:hypothetical protein
MRLSAYGEDVVGYQGAEEDLIREARAKDATHLAITRRSGLIMYEIHADAYRHIDLGLSRPKP